jgi:hypothetical protein
MPALIATVAAWLPVFAGLGLMAQPCLEAAIIGLKKFYYTVHIDTSPLRALAGVETGALQ